ncbi:MAG TPA: amidohydrolase family protein [Thermoplasmata archaeon]|nr:amidohydrolase family protein [Thermoplasmata archaeon]
MGEPPLRTGRVDSHIHLSRWWPRIAETAYRPGLDYSVAGLLQEMDRDGIEFALAIQIFQAPSCKDALTEGRGSFIASGGRLLPVATLDPTRGGPAMTEDLEAIDSEPEIAAIKLFPGYLSFYPTDPRLDPIYEYARERGLPVLFHQGDTLEGRGLLKFARPVEVDEVAGRFRDVRFVLCHLGNPWIDEAAEVVYKNPNVYADTSGLLGPPSAPYFARSLELCRERLMNVILTVGSPERILYGSDWPLEELRTAVDLIDRLDLPDKDKAAILGGNARHLFGLPERRGSVAVPP